MDPVFENYLHYIRNLRYFSFFVLWTIRIIRAFLLASAFLLAWSAIKPESQGEQLILYLALLILGLFLGSKSMTAHPQRERLLKSLEVNYPESKLSAFSLKQKKAANQSWEPMLRKEKSQLFRSEWRYLGFRSTTLVLPAAFFLAALSLSPEGFSTALSNVRKVVAELNRGASLRIIEGVAEEGQEREFNLSSSETLSLELVEQNLIEIKVVDLQNEAPFVTLKPKKKKTDYVQTFRLTSSGDESSDDQSWEYTVSFNVQQDVDIFVSTLSANIPAISVSVKKLPVPVVSLEVATEIDDPWPDDRPMPLKIEAIGTHPLQLVRLKIRVEDQEYEELVSNILATDKKELSVPYSILLESYTRQDISEVEIVAEAIDRHLPNPLLGRSEPLVIRTASAYGRYRSTLDTLKEIKIVMDESLNAGEEQLPEQVHELMEKSQKQAANSPFFDGLDRHLLRTMAANLQQLKDDFSKDGMLQASEDLNRFLFEHETLDDRERDRDFFVAARSLSRVIEQAPDERRLQPSSVIARITSYLQERQRRWKVRTDFLGNDAPEEWQNIKQQPFQQAMKDIQTMSDQDQSSDALQRLSKSVADYRSWIEQLENAEDKKRREMESKRQEGLADARNNLRELQKRQGKVSSKLDRSASRSSQELQDQWSGVKMEQNANVKETSSLEAQLRSLSPLAAERIKAALNSMKSTIDSGNQQAFIQAESSSDMAGRLLRQADSAARQSQQQRQSRGRRRRVTSDQYYGSPVAGGDVDIRREYQVNPRYREEILDQVRRAQQSGQQDERLLERYMRQIIR